MLRGDAGDDVLAPGTGPTASRAARTRPPAARTARSATSSATPTCAVDIVANLTTGSATVSGDTQVLSEVEGLTGGDGDDTLTGTTAPTCSPAGPATTSCTR